MADIKPPGLVRPNLPDDIAIAKRTTGQGQQLPLVLAGPILRQVTKQSVTVWLALRTDATVTLQIFNSAGTQLLSGVANTFELGDRLHVVAVTASFSGSLSPGGIYSYNVQFDASASSGEIGDLFTPGIVVRAGAQAAVQALCYGSFTRPTFVSPPSNLADVRICHGSCRMPHAESRDALEVLDDILRAAILSDPTNVAARPQQLVMTGDQIYADDVCQVLSALTNDAADYLIGKDEPLPKLGANGVPAVVTPYGPTTRKEICTRAGFTTGAGTSHLLSFGDYCAFYLFNWSDTIWPSRFPTYEEIFPQYPRVEPTVPHPKRPNVPGRKYWAFKDYEHEQVFLANFRNALPKVRRVLANIPTYMAIDDHDVTDDFVMNRAVCENILGSDVAELGKRIQFDGVLSYAFFQAWGNTGLTPATAFDARVSELQDAYADWRDANYPVSGAAYDKVYDLLDLPVTVPQIDKATDPAAVKIVELARRPGGTVIPLSYSFRLSWSVHELIGLDTRMHRGYPRARSQNVALASDESLKAQIGDDTPTESRVTFVICPRPPREHPLIAGVSDGITSESKTFARDIESWGQDVTTYESLFSALASRSDRRCRGILLSGDVHHGYACRHQYWSDRPFVEFKASTTPATAVFALFTCSAFKKQITTWFNSIMLHRLGFGTFNLLLMRPFDKRKTTRLTWNRTVTEPLTVGHVTTNETGGPPFDADLKANPGRGLAVIDNLARAVFETGTGSVDETLAEIDIPPDAIAVTTFVASNASRDGVVAKLDDEGIDLSARFAAFTGFLLAGLLTTYDDNLGPGQEVVGANNLGIVTFGVDTNGEATATQTLWWFARDANDNLTARPLSAFPISLALEQKPAV